jgi:hypothetical protein
MHISGTSNHVSIGTFAVATLMIKHLILDNLRVLQSMSIPLFKKSLFHLHTNEYFRVCFPVGQSVQKYLPDAKNPGLLSNQTMMHANGTLDDVWTQAYQRYCRIIIFQNSEYHSLTLKHSPFHSLLNIESILRAREERRIEITMTLTFLVGIVQVENEFSLPTSHRTL